MRFLLSLCSNTIAICHGRLYCISKNRAADISPTISLVYRQASISRAMHQISPRKKATGGDHHRRRNGPAIDQHRRRALRKHPQSIQLHQARRPLQNILIHVLTRQHPLCSVRHAHPARIHLRFAQENTMHPASRRSRRSALPMSAMTVALLSISPIHAPVSSPTRAPRPECRHLKH